MALKCILVEDQTMFRQMLHNMLLGIPGVIVLETAETRAAAIKACDHHQPEMLVLDLALPDGHGLDVARHLVKHNRTAKIVILSGEASTFVCPADLQANVHAVLDKTQAFEDLAEEIAALLGEARTGYPLARQGEIRERLSPREYEIFLLIGRGWLSKEIGEKLSISPQTVQTHRRKIATKLGTSGSELIQLAIKHYQSTMGARG